MNPAEINNSARIVIGAIEAYRSGNASSAAEITDKVSNFIKANEGVITTPQQMQAEKLLGKLTNSQQKNNTCNKLAHLITGIANKHLTEAKKTLNTLCQSIVLNQPLIEKFVGLTTENERVSILIKELKTRQGDDLWKLQFQVLKNMDLLNITDPSLKKELNALLLPHSSEEFIKLTSPHYRLEIAKHEAQTNATGISQIIKDLSISYEEDRFAVASIVASKALHESDWGNNLAEFIQNYDLTEPHRVEIAKILAGKWDSVLFNHFQKFNISNEESRFEIANLLCNKNSLSSVLSVLPDFRLSEEKNIVFAKKVAASDSSQNSNNIMKLGITNKKALFEIFCIYAANKEKNETPAADVDMISVIKKLDLSEEERFQITTILIKSGLASSVTEQFQTFRLNQEHRFAIAKMVCDLNIPYYFNKLSQHIRQFALKAKDKEKITATIAEKDPSTILANVTNFEISLKLANDLLASMLSRENVKVDEDVVKRIKDILTSREYQASRSKKEMLLDGINTLLWHPHYTMAEKNLLLKHIFENEKVKPAYLSLHILSSIMSINPSMILKPEFAPKKEKSNKSEGPSAETVRLKLPIDLEGSLKDLFKQCLRVPETADIEKVYASVADTPRYPLGFVIYALKQTSLSKDEYEEVIKSVQEMAVSVTDGTYKAMRYQTPPGSHLETVFAGRQALEKGWKQGGKSQTVGELYQRDIKVSEEGPVAQDKANERILKDVVGHLRDVTAKYSPQVKNTFEQFFTCLKDPKNCQKALDACNTKLGETIEKLKKQKISLKSLKYDPKNNDTLPYFQCKLEAALIKFVQAPLEKKLAILEKILPHVKIMGDRHFEAELKKLQGILKSPIAAKLIQEKETAYLDDYVVEDSDDWQDLMLIGTEVNSCQNIISGSLNKCLMAYISDGKNRAIVIKDPQTGKIVCRSILRLLLDKETKKPVLFQERVYRGPEVNDKIANAIELMAAQRARDLGIPLVKKAEDVVSKFYLNPLESLGSPAPFEYVDATEGAIKNGVFTISANNLQLVQEPLEPVKK